MKRATARGLLWLLLAAIGGGGQTVYAQSVPPIEPPPLQVPPVDPYLRQAQDEKKDIKLPELPKIEQPTAPPTAPDVSAPAPSAPAAPSGPSLSTNQPAAPDAAAASSQIGAGEAAARPGGDVTELIQRSSSALGVELQKRNAVISDPRVRGFRVGQLVTYGDGGLFVPGRQDFDSAISKFDTNNLQTINIIKGPYSARYGPGFTFIEIVTPDVIDPTRTAFDVAAKTVLGYQTNRARYDGYQSISMGDKDWGIRLGYNFIAGDDYLSGSQQVVPSSFMSNNATFALGWKPTENTLIEFKGFRLAQDDLRFAGQYFDIDRLDTESYRLRFIVTEIGLADNVQLDLWYNFTGASGSNNTVQKQAFLNRVINSPDFLARSNIAPTPTPFSNFGDNTNFSILSRGYRALLEWGEKDQMKIGFGTDLAVLNQQLFEQIGLDVGGNLNTPTGPQPLANVLLAPGTGSRAQQLFGLPDSESVNPGLFMDMFLPVDERLNFKLGGRLDYVSTTAGSRIITGNVLQTNFPGGGGTTTLDTTLFSIDPTNMNRNREFVLFSGYLATDYKIDNNVTASASFGYAQRPPTLTELYANGPFVAALQQGLNRLVGEPQLKQENLRQIDIAINARYDYFRAGATAYYTWVDNYITYDQVQRTQPGDPFNQVVLVNTNLATLAGTELFMEADLTSWLTPFTTISYVQGTDRTPNSNARPRFLNQSGQIVQLVSSRQTPRDSEALPGIPPLEWRNGFRVHSSISRENPNPNWAIEFTARVVMGQNYVATSVGELPSSGFTVFDISAFWKATPKLTLIGGVQNLGNLTYREHLDPRAGFPGDGSLFRPGTNFYFSAQYEY